MSHCQSFSLSRSNIELVVNVFSGVPDSSCIFILGNAIAILASKFEGENCNLHRFRLMFLSKQRRLRSKCTVSLNSLFCYFF